jgi:ankyrin repeat protein
MYGGGSTTLGLVATSCHPRDAGLQQPLIDVLLAHGARLDSQGAGNAHALVNGCLANGRPEAAEYLASRGAPLDLEGAAGVGRLDLVKSFFNADGSLKPPANIAQLKDGFTWACEYGRTDVVEYLLDHGVDASDVLPRPHKQTGLHWAAYGGHVNTVKALLKRRQIQRDGNRTMRPSRYWSPLEHRLNPLG